MNSNIDRTQTCSSNSNTLFLASNNQTSNLIEPSLDLLNCLTTDLNIDFSNIERPRTFSSFGNRTRKPYFYLWTIKHWTSNIVQPIPTHWLEIGITCSVIRRSIQLTQMHYKWTNNVINSKNKRFWMKKKDIAYDKIWTHDHPQKKDSLKS